LTDAETKKLIDDTVRATVMQLQAAGLLRSNTVTAYQKTEELLRQYPRLKTLPGDYARRVVQEIDACLAEVEQEPYADVIRLYYFGGLKNAACAKVLACDERTGRRARRRLVEQFSVRLASEEFIRELLT
jgi:DNA-directed RNA polymerase specialized sigma24 family protein